MGMVIPSVGFGGVPSVGSATPCGVDEMAECSVTEIPLFTSIVTDIISN